MKYILCINPSQLWFLWMLFGIFMIVWPLRCLIINNKTTGWIIAIIFYCTGVVSSLFLPNYFCIWTALQFMPFFYLGIWLRVRVEQNETGMIEDVPWYIWLFIDLFLFVVTLYFSEKKGINWKAFTILLKFFLHVIGSVMAWSILQRIAQKVRWENSFVFEILSNHSMPMYLFHQQIIYFSIVALNGYLSPWLHACLNFLIAVSVSLLLSIVLKRWKLTKFLIGEN